MMFEMSLVEQKKNEKRKKKTKTYIITILFDQTNDR